MVDFVAVMFARSDLNYFSIDIDHEQNINLFLNLFLKLGVFI